jgi:hypothetical protein
LRKQGHLLRVVSDNGIARYWDTFLYEHHHPAPDLVEYRENSRRVSLVSEERRGALVSGRREELWSQRRREEL